MAKKFDLKNPIVLIAIVILGYFIISKGGIFQGAISPGGKEVTRTLTFQSSDPSIGADPEFQYKIYDIHDLLVSYTSTGSPWGVEEKLPSGWRISTRQACTTINDCDWYQDATTYLYECVGGYCTSKKDANDISKITSMHPGIDKLYFSLPNVATDTTYTLTGQFLVGTEGTFTEITSDPTNTITVMNCPNQIEACDSIDNDCDYKIDEGSVCCVDNDGDGYGNPANADCTYPNLDDCNDANSAIYPGATEICADTIDQDCSGADKVGESKADEPPFGDCNNDTTLNEVILAIINYSGVNPSVTLSQIILSIIKYST